MEKFAIYLSVGAVLVGIGWFLFEPGFSSLSAGLSAAVICTLIIKKVTPNRSLETKFIGVLNLMFREEIQFHRILEHEPRLICEGSSDYSKAVNDAASKLVDSGALITNDPHAVLVGDLYTTSDPITFRYLVANFSEVTALRDMGESPKLITANVLAVDPKKRVIILHRRSKVSYLYPGKLSVVGGGYWPTVVGATTGHEDSRLINTAIREFNEETNLGIAIDKKAKKILTQELTSGAIQVNYLGVLIELEEEAIKSGIEGEPELIKFDELHDVLNKKEQWVPLGKSLVLAWLALGAPGSNNAKFGTMRAAKLYEKHVSQFLK